MLSGSSQKPALIILDEVDGTEDSSSRGAMKTLLDYIYGTESENNSKSIK